MEKNELPALLYWKYKNDGTVETNCPVLPAQPPAPIETPPLLDVDKLIKESTGLYSLWWMAFKKNHPERCLIREEPKEPIKAPPKPKVIFKPLSCKRCGSSWTPRSKEPPVQCPRCHSPYWNRERRHDNVV